MARSGRVWLFGSGRARINPIHGADLACVVADATDAGADWIDAGGPEIFTQTELGILAFETVGAAPRITHLPAALRKGLLAVLPWITPRRVHGPLQFFLTACAMDMVGTTFGKRRLADEFKATLTKPAPNTQGDQT